MEYSALMLLTMPSRVHLSDSFPTGFQPPGSLKVRDRFYLPVIGLCTY